MPWYAIRSIFKFQTKKNGLNVYEERIVCFEAGSSADAHAKAKLEAEEYARGLNMVVYSEQEGYEQDGDALIDGYEVWSQLYETSQSIEEFYQDRYARYEYHPE